GRPSPLSSSGTMPFSLTENLPFLALPLALITLKVTYDVLPFMAFLALVAVAVGCYMFYAGKSSPAAQRTAKKAEATADSLIRELTQEEDRAKEEAARKQAAKDRKAAAKQKQEAVRKAAQAAKEAAAAKALAQQEAESKPRAAPQQQQQPSSGKSKKQSKKQSKAAPPVEEEDSDDEDDFLLRMADLERAR
ncbi:unnamed protein product, partial [Ectocarpus sp. 6 AP-2014]